jgi:hypothetical protein|tara:strand:+ start:4308 stop:4661 length:354 start_codon:yes stop_codon:yes gene_type:complete
MKKTIEIEPTTMYSEKIIDFEYNIGQNLVRVEAIILYLTKEKYNFSTSTQAIINNVYLIQTDCDKNTHTWGSLYSEFFIKDLYVRKWASVEMISVEDLLQEAALNLFYGEESPVWEN